MLQQCKTIFIPIQSKKEFLTNEISPNLRCMFSRLSNLCPVLHTSKTGSFKDLLLLTKTRHSKLYRLTKKNGFKSKLWIKKFITISEIAIEHSIACHDALFVRNLNTSRAKNLKSYKNRLETESLRFLFHILHEMLFHYFWRLFLKDALFKFCR